MADAKYYRGILDALPERVVRYCLPDLTIVYCNSAWAAGHHLAPAGVIGHALTDFLSESERRGLRSQLARLSTDKSYLADDRPQPRRTHPGNGWNGSIRICRRPKGPKSWQLAGT